MEDSPVERAPCPSTPKSAEEEEMQREIEDMASKDIDGGDVEDDLTISSDVEVEDGGKKEVPQSSDSTSKEIPLDTPVSSVPDTNDMSICDAIGRTPIVELGRMTKNLEGRVFCKVESANPAGSVKDRIALSMIQDAERKGLLLPGGAVVEATSGNTGIALAMVCRAKGYRCILYMPETMTIERRKILQLRGAELVLVPKEAGKGMSGATKMAKAAAEQYGHYYIDQFSNPSNIKAHREHTAPEIVEFFKAKGLQIDYFVAGIGTGGTISGCSPILKWAFPKCKVIGVEPAGSPVLSGGKAGPHTIQGIGAGFVPRILNRFSIDRVMQVTNDEALRMQIEMSLQDGIFCGISSGAAVVAAMKLLREVGEGKNIVCICPDGGDRYLSILNRMSI